MKISCVIPAYNEEKNIIEAIKRAKVFVDEVIVVDDCSEDDTYNLAKKTDAKVLKHIINRGQGASLQTGNDCALRNGADIVIHFDADNQFIAEEIPELINPIVNEGYQVVFGSRFMGKKNNMPKFKKKIIMPLARLINKVFFNIRLTDPQSGFRAMNKEAVKKIKIENDRMAHCSEIIFKSFKYNLKLKEVPTTVVYHDFGQKMGSGFKILKDIFISKLSN